jgi:hypothetical protein
MSAIYPSETRLRLANSELVANIFSPILDSVPSISMGRGGRRQCHGHRYQYYRYQLARLPHPLRSLALFNLVGSILPNVSVGQNSTGDEQASSPH